MALDAAEEEHTDGEPAVFTVLGSHGATHGLDEAPYESEPHTGSLRCAGQFLLPAAKRLEPPIAARNGLT